MTHTRTFFITQRSKDVLLRRQELSRGGSTLEGLAPLLRAEIWRVLEYVKIAGQAILLIDKHVTALSRIADRHYIIARGQVVWSGTSQALRADAVLRQRYLGV